MAIAGALIEPLSVAIARAIRPAELSLVMIKMTGDDLYFWVARGTSDRQTTIDLVTAVSEKDLEVTVLAEILRRRPGNPGLRDLVAVAAPAALTAPEPEPMGLSAQIGGKPNPDPNLTNALAPGLQRNVRPHLAKLDLMVWVQQLLEVKSRVCRIEIGGRAQGTGFLVGPAAVLTNWHVVENAVAAGTLGTAQCRFDYFRLPNGTRHAGVTVPVTADALADHTPYASAEKTATPEQPPPAPGELDYALLRLAEPAGEHSLDTGPRGWMNLPVAPFPVAPDDALLIVQHPDGAPLKLAMDTQSVIGPNVNGTRLRYHTNTEPGSSGSPCFTMDWDLVALHHYGDPSWQQALFNQGVPVELIRRSIEARGHGALLGDGP